MQFPGTAYLSTRTIAGHPAATLCTLHERIVQPVELQIGVEVQFACPYCLQEEIPENMRGGDVEDKTPPTKAFERHPQVSVMHSHWYRNGGKLRHICPYQSCPFESDDWAEMEGHKIAAHTPAHGDWCAVANCRETAKFTCRECEEVFCDGHMTQTPVCVVCAGV